MVACHTLCFTFFLRAGFFRPSLPTGDERAVLTKAS
nr:MAG TPA: hypothetical protein [Caudoviricetes sp.]